MCILDKGHFLLLDVDANLGMIGLTLINCQSTSYHHHHHHHHLYYHYHDHSYYYHICHVCYLRRLLMRGLGWGSIEPHWRSRSSFNRAASEKGEARGTSDVLTGSRPSFLLESSLLPLGLPLINQGKQGKATEDFFQPAALLLLLLLQLLCHALSPYESHLTYLVSTPTTPPTVDQSLVTDK